MVIHISRMRWFGHVERMEWDEVLVDDRKKLGMDSADPQNRYEWGGQLRGSFVSQDQPSVEESKL